MSERPTSYQIDEQAAAWVVLCDKGELGEVEAEALEVWLKSDVRASGAYLRAQALWQGVERIETFEHNRDGKLSRRRMLRWGAAAACVVGATTLWPVLQSGKAYATDIGEVMRVPLGDGASVTLNTDSRVRVEQKGASQIVKLERGEAYFSITPAASSRTEIHVKSRVLTPGASAFSVHLKGQSDAVITIEKGAVSVDQHHGITANTEVRLGTKGIAVADVKAGDIERSLMWLQGKLVFQGETLSQAAEGFARYGGPMIFIPDEDLAAETVTGLFDANDAHGFANAVAASLGARVERKSNRLIILW